MNSLNVSFKKYNYFSLILILILFSIYIFENSILYKKLDYNTYVYYIKPILWTSVFIFIYYFMPKVNSKSKIKYKGYFALWAIMCGIIYITIYMAAGFINGYGTNPYDFTPVFFILKIVSEICYIIGRESLRYFLLNKPYSNHRNTAHAMILIVMTVTEINIVSLTNILSIKDLVIFISEVLGPTLSKNFLLNYLSSVGTLASSVIYLSIVNLFLYISPVLSSLQWLTKGVVGICIPLFSYMFISSAYSKLTREYKPYREKAENVFSWILTCIFSIGIIWFAVGVFPVFPSVIVTGSMEPLIMPGDVALIKKIANNDELNKIQIGDVIQFKRDEILIVHRIIDIVEAEGIICYKTKGDNNSEEDKELVKAENIKGRLYKVVPKLGIPTLIYRNNDNVDLLKLVF